MFNDFVQMFTRVPAEDLFFIVLICGGLAAILIPPNRED